MNQNDNDDYKLNDPYFWIDLIFDFIVVIISFVVLYFLI